MSSREPQSSAGIDFGRTARQWWNVSTAFLKAFIPPKLEEDDLQEAIDLNDHFEEVKADPQLADFGKVSNLTMAYYKAAFNRIKENPAVTDALPGFFTLLNGAVVLLFLRLLLPRLLAIQSMQDIADIAPELGLPTREELLQYVQYADEMNFLTKLALFLVVITIEKVTLVGEFVPVGIVLPALSPLLFGGVLEGTVISAACASAGSTVNFLLGQNVLRERALQLEVFDQPPLGESAWFQALSRNIEKDGFKAALLLRLAPILPIPIDAHWYVCGLTPLKWWEFSSAYFVGALKATFLDAYLGSLLTSAAIGTDEVASGSKALLVGETIAIVTVSVLVSQFATQVFAEAMSEEGFTDAASPRDAPAGSIDDNAAETENASSLQEKPQAQEVKTQTDATSQ